MFKSIEHLFIHNLIYNTYINFDKKSVYAVVGVKNTLIAYLFTYMLIPVINNGLSERTVSKCILLPNKWKLLTNDTLDISIIINYQNFSLHPPRS